MTNQSIIKQTADYVRKALSGESSGHDWWHTERVWKNALLIAKHEKNIDLLIVQLAALLHDIADWKFHGGDDSVGPEKAREWLTSLKVDKKTISHVCEIIPAMSFKGAGVKSVMKSKEGMIVQDADRLDAIGAIGIARCFATGSKLGIMIYDPTTKPVFHKSAKEYVAAKTTSINHFYEKLLLLKDLMNTATAKKIAQKRHKVMEQYLDEFFKEWDGQV
jgi:uncharacterized protein